MPAQCYVLDLALSSHMVPPILQLPLARPSRVPADTPSPGSPLTRPPPPHPPPPQVDTFPHMGDASRVLLASAGRLAWYRYDTDELRVLHEGAVS